MRHRNLIGMIVALVCSLPIAASARNTNDSREESVTELLARAGEDIEKVLPRPSATSTDPDRPTPIRNEAPIPPKARPEGETGPGVRIRTEGDMRIEEYREGGRLVMIRVVPPVGIPYSFVDTDGDGRLEGEPGTLHGGVKPVFYTLYEWE